MTAKKYPNRVSSLKTLISFSPLIKELSFQWAIHDFALIEYLLIAYLWGIVYNSRNEKYIHTRRDIKIYTF